METLGPRPSSHLKWRGSIPLEYRYTAGIAGQKFLSALKERGKIVGSRCQRCGDRRVPPRLYCVNCYGEITIYEDLEGDWTVFSFAVERVGPEAIVYGLFRFQGVQGGLVHRLIGVDPEGVRVGMKVAPVIRERRRGSILDLEGFKPVSLDQQPPSGRGL